MPRGHTAYLGILGTKREGSSTNRKSFDAGDFYGYITGARLLHGLSDRLTLGAAVACEENHHHRYLDDEGISDNRPYPESSGQAGAMLSYLPFDNLILSGDVAGSQGQRQDGYDDAETEETLSLVHDLKLDVKGHPLQLRSEFIKELSDEPGGKEYGFRARGEYLLDRVGYNHLGVMGEYRQGEYAFLLYLNIRQLYSQHDGRLIKVNESRIRTAYGAVHGKVFLDYNGNHLADVNEPGVPNVKVCLGQSLRVLTDKKGYYILSTPPSASEVRVYLDDVQSDLLVADSFTAGDGSYYLGEIKPGRYKLRVDLKTLPAAHALDEQERIVVIEPTKEEFMEVELPDFVATVRNELKPAANTPPADSQKK